MIFKTFTNENLKSDKGLGLDFDWTLPTHEYSLIEAVQVKLCYPYIKSFSLNLYYTPAA